MAEYRLVSLIVWAASSACVVACGGSTSDGTGSTQSAVTIQAKDETTTFTVDSASGQCVDAKQFFDQNKDVIAGQCGKGKIALPAIGNDSSCEPGKLAQLTFDCFDAKFPPPPPAGACKPLVLKDPKGLVPDDVAQAIPKQPWLLCPALPGMVPPPVDPNDPNAPALPPPPSDPSAGGQQPLPPDPNAPMPGGDPNAPNANGQVPPQGPPPPPAFQCCAPPPPMPPLPPGNGSNQPSK